VAIWRVIADAAAGRDVAAMQGRAAEQKIADCYFPGALCTLSSS
jgi:hypothetical protein